MNMVSDEPQIKPVVINSESLPQKPQIRFWHWAHYYFYNLTRRPKVWAKQRELKNISNQIRYSLEKTVYPVLTENARKGCEMCRDSFGVLYPQIFLSQIELILKRMKCSSHHRIFENFLLIHQQKFHESEKIAKWINGFE